jgi:hypothetical protein
VGLVVVSWPLLYPEGVCPQLREVEASVPGVIASG